MTTFSVLIANYNNGQYLQDALNSVFNQTYSNWEIIIVDDCSTDNSHELYNNYVDDSRIHIYYNNRNYGCGYTKRRCVELAHGDDFNVFDLNWNRKDEWISEKYRNNVIVPKPHDLHKLLEYAQILSSGIPQVRVDFYDINGNIYFGEMTFTSACGRMTYFKPEFLLKWEN